VAGNRSRNPCTQAQQTSDAGRRHIEDDVGTDEIVVPLQRKKSRAAELESQARRESPFHPRLCPTSTQKRDSERGKAVSLPQAHSTPSRAALRKRGLPAAEAMAPATLTAATGRRWFKRPQRVPPTIMRQSGQCPGRLAGQPRSTVRSALLDDHRAFVHAHTALERERPGLIGRDVHL
jgi:hypothetical protein